MRRVPATKRRRYVRRTGTRKERIDIPSMPKAIAHDDGSFEFFVRMKTAGGLNNREHWRARTKRVTREKLLTLLAANASGMRHLVEFPCVVRMTRLSPGKLDDDNLAGSLKSARDQIAAWLDVDDGRIEIVRYMCSQVKCRKGEEGVIVRIFSRTKLVETLERV